MILQRRRLGSKNESVGLLNSEDLGGSKLSDDYDGWSGVSKPTSSWDALWMQKKKNKRPSLICQSNHYQVYSEDMKVPNEQQLRGIQRSQSTSSDSGGRDLPEKSWKDPVSRSCLTKPGFMKRRSSSEDDDDETEATAPPSPMTPEKVYSSSNNILTESPKSIVSDIRYSLRTAIGTGFRQEEKERELRPNGVRINVSHWSDKGHRPYMEDRYVVENMGAVQVELSSSTEFGESVEHPEKDINNTTKRIVKMPLTWVGVFDGHGGDKASQYCADWMSSYVKSQQTYPHDLGFAVRDAFCNIDCDFCLSGHVDGTTACVACIIGNRRIVCANAGDSRAIVVRKDGTVVRISRDHKPQLSDEYARITDLGGKVVFWQKRWRVEGLLAVSRGIGDSPLKPYVSADPEVCEYNVRPDDMFLLISSDGVWDVASNEDAAHVILESSYAKKENGKVVQVDPERFKWAARNLCLHAKNCGSTDNFAVVCVDLQSSGNPKFELASEDESSTNEI